MIPEFTEIGLLPPGIHSATWEEFEERFLVFQQSDQRLRIGERLLAFYNELRRAGIVRRILIVGSYVADKAEPNDYDCLLVLDPAAVVSELLPFQYNLLSRRMARRMFHGDVIAVIDGSAAMKEFLEFFQTTRDGSRTGIVELQL